MSVLIIDQCMYLTMIQHLLFSNYIRTCRKKSQFSLLFFFYIYCLIPFHLCMFLFFFLEKNLQGISISYATSNVLPSFVNQHYIPTFFSKYLQYDNRPVQQPLLYFILFFKFHFDLYKLFENQEKK